jgi:hypothetical protein
MCDKLVFDLAQEVEGSPSVFIRKDWINCLDNQNQNYNNNQSIIDTSQICNSNKYMSYREAYLSIPFTITLGNTAILASAGNATTAYWTPNTALYSTDYCLGLKNWFGQIIHSFTLDYNGTTIIQQTPYINMWNSFKLNTSLSLDDIDTQGATIGFYPDDPLTWTYAPFNCFNLNGNGTCNNTNASMTPNLNSQFNVFKSGYGNDGFLNRQRLINFDPAGNVSGTSNVVAPANSTTFGNLIYNGANSLNLLWKSYIYNKADQTGATTATAGIFQIAVVATVYLKHIHDFFNMTPLLKGVFMKMTMNLNNTSSTIAFNSQNGNANTNYAPVSQYCTAVQNPLGGVNPLMVSSSNLAKVGTASQYQQINGGYNLYIQGTNTNANAWLTQTYIFNISVGSVCLDQTLKQNPNYRDGPLSKSIYLYIPAYTFNPPFEQAYLSSPVKTIKYSDLYQYQVINVSSGQNFNNLLTNGIANVKSVLVLPFYCASTAGSTTGGATTLQVSNSNNTGFLTGTPVWQSPFDPAGTGPTSPLCYLTNFNIQVSGQNAIYNTERYNFEQFNNQLYGQNAVNGGQTDGLTSSLVNRQSFDNIYNYYYVNVERMLPAEQQVPKSIQILGQNLSASALDLYCFVEFGVEIKIECLTGARV